MAKPDKATSEVAEIKGPTALVPEGFQAVAPLEGQAQWWKMSAGAVLYGRLIGRFVRRDGKAYYQLRVGDPVKLAQLLKKNPSEIAPPLAIRGSGDEAAEVKVNPGDIINFDERSALEILAGYAASDGTFDVFIHVLEKIKIPNTSHTWWRIIPSIMTLKAPSKPIVQPKRESGPDRFTADDDIPF